jgi:hypothetical protein
MIFINQHEIRLDESEGLLPWTDYDRVVRLAMDFIRRCPVEPRSGLPWYLVYSCFWTDPLRPTMWPDNPAGKFAMAVETLARYQAYSGETWMTDVVHQMLDRLAAHQTPSDFDWPGMPYASAEPALGEYRGARADGYEVIEPDKAAQAALGNLRFHQVTGEAPYLERALQCARTLAAKRRTGDADHSPWPFRVNARTGEVVEEYTAHVIAAVRLFEELVALGADEDGLLARAGAETLAWLRRFPLANNVWKGYFEDIRLDPENRNRDQYSALETARYLLASVGRSEQDVAQAEAIIEWVEDTLAAEPFFKALAIHEQLFCYHVMGSHTARYASLCAALHACTGQAVWRERAVRSLNWATYMATDSGIVLMGVDRPDYYNQCWFTDSYFDYVPHFLDAMCSIPALAPADQDHLLGTTSVVQHIDYQPLQVSYRTIHPRGEETLRLSFVPREVICDGRRLAARGQDGQGAAPGWAFDPDERVLRVRRAGHAVVIHGEPVAEDQA